MVGCRKPLVGSALTAILLVSGVPPGGRASQSQTEPVEPAAARPVNLLFIMTDQQRFDALSRAGNTELETPNLDQLARDGAYFVNAYTPSPICVPARAAILTGHSIESVRMTRNSEINRPDAAPVPSFDNILAHTGYHTEYYGKWHAPYKLASTYKNRVRPTNKNKGAPSTVTTQSDAFRQFVKRNVTPRPPDAGELLDDRSGRPYVPDLAVWQRSIQAFRRSRGLIEKPTDRVFGRLDLPSEFGRTAFAVKEAMQALEQIKDRPFSLTCSIAPPHPPFLVSEPYHSMYPPETLSLPLSMTDSMVNSPYRKKASSNQAHGYRNPDMVRRMKANYYGLVREVDVWLGRLLAKLRDLDLDKNTLVIFTSDHGEMLGDHGIGGKGIFYEGAVHVPLLIRLPGTIPSGTIVETPVSTIDLFATILDYTGHTGHTSEGRSLRGLIEGTEMDGPDYCVSERPLQIMVRTKRWKLLLPSRLNSGASPALYDLENDPHELTKLLGYNPNRDQYRAVVEEMKGHLVSWLEKVKSPYLEQVQQRPVIR